MERYFLCQQSIDEGGAAEGVRTKVVFMPAVHGKILFMPAVHWRGRRSRGSKNKGTVVFMTAVHGKVPVLFLLAVH